MTARPWIARTPTASGRFLFVALFLTGCQVVGSPGARTPPAPSWPDPVLAPGPISPARESQAAELFASAQRALEGGDATQARALAGRIVQEYPSAPVSGRALFLLAQASLDDGAPTAADSAAERFVSLLAEGDPRGAEARVLQADAMARLGDEARRLDRLLLIRPGAPTNVLLHASEGAREAASRLGPDELSDVLLRTPRDAPLRPIALTSYALLLHRNGDETQAMSFARAAIDAGARGVDSLTASAILEGREVDLPGGTRTLGIASVLPIGGSPGFREFAEQIAEGVAVAASSYLGPSVEVHVDARDDRGEPAIAASTVLALEETRAVGAVGFLESGALEAAAQERTSPMPLVSPTARTASAAGTYTLSGADPFAAAAMARYAERAGFVRVAVINSKAPESSEEADAFVNALQDTGVQLAGRFVYDVGATYFGDQIRGAREALRKEEIAALGLGPDDTLHVEMLQPVAVFIPIPPEDVELVAPQVTFFGLDTLAIRTLGTSGWTDAETLETVDQRHTNGVIAIAPVDAGPGSPGYTRFKDAFEDHFRRSLVSPVPALGYDAALLILEAARNGAGTAAGVRASLERIHDLEGATGTFSLIDGRVVRRTHIVQIEHGTLIPAG
jgi:ABC-type branched-subunit amino acid transport system substrate-binding protein